MSKKRTPYTQYTEFPIPIPDGFDFRRLAGVLLTDEESAAWRKYAKEHPSGPTAPEKKRYVDALEKVKAEMPTPKNDREDRIYWGAQTLGTIQAMMDLELFWDLHQAKYRRAGVAKIHAVHDPKHERMADRYDELKDEIGDLPARKIIAEDEGITLTHLNRVLKKQGRR